MLALVYRPLTVKDIMHISVESDDLVFAFLLVLHPHSEQGIISLLGCLVMVVDRLKKKVVPLHTLKHPLKIYFSTVLSNLT